jgi:hypothetical protein
MKNQKPNKQRSDVKNPNNPAFPPDLMNREKQKESLSPKSIIKNNQTNLKINY